MKKVLAQICFILLIAYMFPLMVVMALIIFTLRTVFGLERVAIDGKGKYVFREETFVALDVTELGSVSFKQQGKSWFSIDPLPVGSRLNIHGSPGSAYAWDGCSPKFLILGLAMGTPDGAVNPKTGKPITYYASMAHDVLYQFRKQLKGTVTRKQADRVFLELLRKDGFELAEVYYRAVRLFGWTYWPPFSKNSTPKI